jgi:hypothetical protein
MGDGNAECAPTHPAGEGVEAQSTMAQVDDDGDEEAHATPPCRAKERRSIGFAIEREVDGDAGAEFECRQAGNSGGGEVGAQMMVCGGQCAPFGPQFFA